MPTLTITAATTPTNYPTGTTIGGYQFKVDAVQQTENGPSSVFTNIAPGNHTISCQALNGSAIPMGTAITANITLTDPGVNLALPSNLSYTYTA